MDNSDLNETFSDIFQQEIGEAMDLDTTYGLGEEFEMDAVLPILLTSESSSRPSAPPADPYFPISCQMEADTACSSGAMSTPGFVLPPLPSSSFPSPPHPSTETPEPQQTASVVATVNPSHVQLPPKRGRPPGSKKQPAIGPCRPVGRPRGSGPKQRAKAAEALLRQGGLPSPQKKRPVGRPRKGGTARGGADDRSLVSIEFGKLVVPGSHQQPRRHVPAVPLPPTLSHPPCSRPLSLPEAEAAIRCIVPEEDPQCPVDLGDDEGEFQLCGEEDDLTVEGDEAGDECDPAVEDISGPQGHSLPPWLLDEFRAKVVDCSKRDSDGLPPLYAHHQTFWFPQPATFFLLCHSNKSLRNFTIPTFSCGTLSCCALRAFLAQNAITFFNDMATFHTHADVSILTDILDYWLSLPMLQMCSPTVWKIWDSHILAVLPPELAAEFPARLSYWSGMSTTLFGWMRSCFQNGMGAKPFSDALRIQHLQKYDEIELQYLDVLAGFKLDGWAGQTYKAFLPFDDHSPDGPFGFVPSGSWVREMYDRFIEEHHDEFNQHMALLTAEIIALDHSHKLTKQIYKVNGKEVFTALLTVTNEKGEIQSCNLVATKSHKQFELALHAILKSLHLYGHLPPGLAFTDNIQGDRQFLEESFPSLREGVVPVEKYPDLDPLHIPPDVIVIRKSSATTIDDTMRTIIDSLPKDDLDARIVIGFDSEWNVEISGNGHIFHRGKTAIIQIAYDNRVYILQIGDMLAGGKLPRQLEILLSHPRILKAGRLVEADLRYLQDACQSRDPFVGALDLAKYAKD
ncbi:hypothetical protein CPB84DRAFT_1752008 [Gymnopilus junonius]|uniref:Uncharacterized protein n=1 Tax=Gymnopilus junonius TaxID=109634 RepID=A0A9P5NB31_GYMJU|nr:hypothetical protein CPB84DRAFT_1752008 [Gymnopilus junonius]